MQERSDTPCSCFTFACLVWNGKWNRLILAGTNLTSRHGFRWPTQRQVAGTTGCEAASPSETTNRQSTCCWCVRLLASSHALCQNLTSHHICARIGNQWQCLWLQRYNLQPCSNHRYYYYYWFCRPLVGPLAARRKAATYAQENRVNVHRHPCLEWDLGGRRQLMPQTVRPIKPHTGPMSRRSTVAMGWTTEESESRIFTSPYRRGPPSPVSSKHRG
jgi:hypothetical protein